MRVHITRHAIERASERTLKAWRACPSDAAKAGLREWLTHLCQLATAPMKGAPITGSVAARVRGILLILEPTADGGVSLVTVMDKSKGGTNRRDRPKPAKVKNDRRCKLGLHKRKAARERIDPEDASHLDDSTASFSLAGE